MNFRLLPLLLVICFVESKSTFGQDEVTRSLLDTTISIFKRNAVNASSVNWDTLRSNALNKAKNAVTPYDLGPTIRYLFKSVNDYHGRYFYRDSIFQWTPNILDISDSIKNEWKKGARVQSHFLNNSIGYLRVPSMSGSSKGDFDKKAQMLNDSLCSVLIKNPKGLILDFRLNGGGAIHPMILGLEPLLPQGIIGSFQVKTRENWILKKHTFLIDTAMLASIVPSCSVNAQSLPLVILIGQGTGSSGEFLILPFKGRSKTLLLGSKTAGYTTVVNGFQINESAFLNLSVGYGFDRAGNMYAEALEPDILMHSVDKFNTIGNDEKIKFAIEWLMSN